MVSLAGEVVCGHHQVRGRCFVCARPLCGVLEPPWRALDEGLSCCPTCSIGAVDDRAAVRAALPDLRTGLADLGFVMARKVAISLVDAPTLRRSLPDGGHPLGLTRLVGRDKRNMDVVRIEVLQGLPPIMFGRTVSHEIGHAWLAMAGARAVEEQVEEGFCELAAYAWLRRLGTPLALALRERMLTNPDPIYGDGFRLLQAAVRTHGLNAIVAELARTGRLPT